MSDYSKTRDAEVMSEMPTNFSGIDGSFLLKPETLL